MWKSQAIRPWEAAEDALVDQCGVVQGEFLRCGGLPEPGGAASSGLQPSSTWNQRLWLDLMSEA